MLVGRPKTGVKIKGGLHDVVAFIAGSGMGFFQEVSKIFQKTATNIIRKNYVFQKYHQHYIKCGLRASAIK